MVSLSARTDRLIDRLQQLGVAIDRLERCGPGAERAAYNMGVNRLCLSQGLSDEPGLQLDVLTHEAIHVVQDCLDGLETPSSSTISLMLQAQGGFSPEQVDRFLAHHLDRSTAEHVLKVTRCSGRCSDSEKLRPMRFRARPAWSNPCWPGIAEVAQGEALWPHRLY